MLQSQLVRNNLTEEQISESKVIFIDRDTESVLIREYGCSGADWHFISYATGKNTISTDSYIICERVQTHWKGFLSNVKEIQEDRRKYNFLSMELDDLSIEIEYIWQLKVILTRSEKEGDAVLADILAERLNSKKAKQREVIDLLNVFKVR